MRKAVESRRALLASAACVLILLVWRRLLLQGELPVDGNLLTFTLPNWRLLRWLWEAPALPLWDPWRSLGQPWLADPQTMALYPPAWLLGAMPGFDGFLRLWVVFHSLLTGLFWGAWARRRTGDDAAAAAAAVLGACNGFLTARVTFPNHFASAAWLPGALLALEAGSPLGLGAALCLQWLAGFPPLSIVTGVVLCAVAASRGRKAWLVLLKGGAWALGLGAAQWVPFLELFGRSVRPAVLGAEQATVYSVAPAQLLKQLLLPLWPLISPALEGDPAIVGFYVGPVALALAGLAAWRGQRWLAAGAVAALALALGKFLPGYAEVGALRAFRFPANWLLAATAALVALAALGTALLPRRWRWPAAALLALDLAVFAQAPRHAWARPELASSRPALAFQVPVLARVFHTDELRATWERQSLESEEDFLTLREALAPSFGAAHRVFEASSYQPLKSPEALAFRKTLPLERAGVSHVLALKPGASRVTRETVAVTRTARREERVFLVGEGRASLKSWRPGRATAGVDAPKGGLVVLGEASYPGWEARVDGKPAPLELVDGIFSGVRVEPGAREVEFLFRSRSFLLGLLVSLVTLVAAAFRLFQRD